MWGKPRWRSTARKKGGWKRKLFFVLVIMFLLSVQTFVFIEKNLKPPLMSVAKIRVKQIATQAINTAISDQIGDRSDYEKLVDWKTDRQGKITGFMLNYAEHMKIRTETINAVSNLLNKMSAFPEHIPLGQALGSAILASFGPDIPVRLVPAGAARVDLNTRQQDAGINMVLVEVYIRIIAEVAIIIPFDSESELVETEIPISYMLVVGDVPMYYYDGKGNPTGNSAGKAPSISLPMTSPNAKPGMLPKSEPSTTTTVPKEGE